LFESPEPHPLDYDWRFEQNTVQALTDIVPATGRVLIVGAPSVARRVEMSERDVVLVDRQPLQGVANQYVREVASFTIPEESFAAAIVDPPWYPDTWRLWTAWTARFVRPNGELFVSIWPSDTRPHAADEISAIEAWASTWAKIETAALCLNYQIPVFEQAATAVADDKALAHSPRQGSLLRLRIKSVPTLNHGMQARTTWRRFVFNDYQLALRVGPTSNELPTLRALSRAKGWIWPYVSNRAPNRESIDLWSSHNEVAAITNSFEVATAIRNAAHTQTAEEFERVLMRVPSLLQWQIPRPPYRRILEWHHQQ
jgi:hypothetical protein